METLVKIFIILCRIAIIVGAFWVFFGWGLLIRIRDAIDHGDYGLLISIGIFAFATFLACKLVGRKKH